MTLVRSALGVEAFGSAQAQHATDDEALLPVVDE